MTVVLAMLAAGCTTASTPSTTSATPATATSPTSPTSAVLTTTSSSTTTTVRPTTTVPTTTVPTTSTSLPAGVVAPPDWLGERPLPMDQDGNPIPQPTPEIMEDRRFATVDVLPPPDEETFTSWISPVPPEVAERSTWEPGCPIDLEDLRYATLSFWGFDHEPHTGELIVHAEAAEAVVGVFERLYEERFPIEAMEIRSSADLEAELTGDGNVTESFVCRPATGGTSWSQHAYGLAVDINPFHNPYVRGDVLIPELAGAYTDRSWVRPGMIVEGDAVTKAFDAIGWGWGGRWKSLTDPQHFSRSGT